MSKSKTKAAEGFWGTMNQFAYEERAKTDKVSVAEARRRIISETAKSWGVSFAEAERRTERPDGAR